MVFYILQLNTNTNKLKDIEHNMHLMIMRADELRQSSDDLSKFVNKYVITADTTYKDNYFTTLAIRNGEAPRPANYEGIYWDLSKKIREKNHPQDRKISLKKEMQELPYTPYEFQRLQNSEDNSNDLVNLEIEAFNAMNGLYKDEIGNYTLKSNPNQQLAIKLINSKDYEKAKEKIMLPIDEFLTSVKTRTQQSINRCNEKITDTFNQIFFLLFFGLILFLLTIIIIRKKILTPIASLSDTILDFQIGKTDTKEFIYYADEVGLMSKQFFAMKKKINDDYEAIRLLSLTDPLTKIGNRRAFFEISEQLLKLANRDNEQMALMILDIDFFKKVNDTYGHLVGDEILKLLVKNVKNELRESDIFSRYGGEEFIILLPKTDADGALIVAENIRKYIENSIYTEADFSVI